MNKYSLKINKKNYDLEVKSLTVEKAEIEVNNTLYKIDITNIENDKPKLRSLPSTPPNMPKGKAKKAVETASVNPSSGGKGIVIAPIPGSIIALNVKEGDSVTKGQPILKMEAMKMENEITAQNDGTVSAVYVKEGDAVNQGAKLMIIS